MTIWDYEAMYIPIAQYSVYTACLADQTIPLMLGIITNPLFMIVTSICDVQVFW